MNRDQLIQAYGFTAVPRSTTALLATRNNPSAQPTVLTPDDISVIHSWLTANERLVAINTYAKDKLPEPTYNHSLRVYLYGLAIARDHFPAWLRGREVKSTYLLSCLLHDIGTTDENINSTLMSFEFQGGLIALELLREKGFEREQAEGVAETVIRHQDLGETGTVTTVTALILLGTIFDNVCPPELESLVHPDTIKNVVAAYPRHKWSSCFAATIHKENGLKPWAHTTHLGEEDFPNGVLGNTVMEPYE